MNKPIFDPNKPFVIHEKPQFDPNQPVEEIVEPSSPLLDGTVDLAKGGIQGFMMGGADEAGGLLQSIWEQLSQEDTPEKKLAFVDLYRQKQKELQKSFEESEKRSPWLYGTGQLAGGITSGMILGGALGVGAKAAGSIKGATSLAPEAINVAKTAKSLTPFESIVSGAKSLTPFESISAGLEVVPQSANLATTLQKTPTTIENLLSLTGRGLKTYKQALPIILGESALSSKKGDLSSIEGAKQLGKDVLGGAAFAVPATIGLQTVAEKAVPSISKFLNNASNFEDSNNPLLRQIYRGMKEASETGINPRSETARHNYLDPNGVSSLDSIHTQVITNKISAAQNEISNDMQNALLKASVEGKVVELTPNLKTSLDQLNKLADEFPGLLKGGDAKKMSEKLQHIINTKVNLNPKETKDVIKDIQTYINELYSIDRPTIEQRNILGVLNNTKTDLLDELNRLVPEHKIHSQRYHEFLKLGPETIIAGQIPEEVVGKWAADRTNPELDLYKKVHELVTKTTKEGSGYDTTDTAYVKAMQGLSKFEQNEANRISTGQIEKSALNEPVSDIAKQIRDFSDSAVVRNTSGVIAPQQGVSNSKSMLQHAAGLVGTGRSGLMSSGIIAGQIKHYINQSPTRNKLANISRTIYNAPTEVLSSLANKLQKIEGLSKYGIQLQQSLSSPDQNRRNQILFTMMQNPSARIVIGQHNEIEPIRDEEYNP